jgi:hypothetical protein
VLSRDQVDAAALKALNTARDAFDDVDAQVRAPGDSEPGEFYVVMDGVELAVKIEPL